MITILESGMSFGPFAESHCFRIENSPLHESTQPGVRMAELLLVRDQPEPLPTQVWIIEAKSSSPNPGSSMSDSSLTFSAFIQEIRDKLLNALTLGVTACWGRHENSKQKLPEALSVLVMNQAVIRLVLVVNGHKPEWLPPLQDALVRALWVTSRTWNLGAGSVVVLNDSLARQRGIVT